jgi:hypothetical protein
MVPRTGLTLFNKTRRVRDIDVGEVAMKDVIVAALGAAVAISAAGAEELGQATYYTFA